jgi:hypothetical protein
MATALQAADAAMPLLGRKLDQDRRRLFAQSYDRTRSLTLEQFLPRKLHGVALIAPRDPQVTWEIIRSLCASLRRARHQGARVSVVTLRTLITCEIHLYARQRGAEIASADPLFAAREAPMPIQHAAE